MSEPDNNISSKSKENILPLVAILATWLVIFYPLLISPYIQGVDSVTRLVNLDKFIVVVMNNPWLPLLQAILRFINLFFDTPQAYKITIAIIALGGMTFFYLVLAHTLGRFCAVLSSLFFFTHLPWIWVATTPYMESLLLLLGAGSIYAYLNKKFTLARTLFILATFARPEVLIAAPAILLGTYLYKRSSRQVFLLALLYLPIIAYYIFLKTNLEGFSLPQTIGHTEILRMVKKLFYGFTYMRGLIVGSLAICGILILIIEPSFLPRKRKPLLIIFSSLMIFYLTFIILIPFLHTLSHGGARHTILTILPAFIFASIFMRYLLERFPEYTSYAAVAFITLSVTTGFNYRHEKTPIAYKTVKRIVSAIDKTGSARPRELSYCSLDPEMLINKGIHPVHFNPILLNFRFFGVTLKEMPCLYNQGRWLNEKETQFLRLYGANSIKKEYEQQLTEGCKTYSVWYRSGKPFIKLCL